MAGLRESVTLQTVCVWFETGVPIRAETSTARPGTGRVIMLRLRSLRGPRTAGPFLPASLPNPPRASISAAREHAICFGFEYEQTRALAPAGSAAAFGGKRTRRAAHGSPLSGSRGAARRAGRSPRPTPWRAPPSPTRTSPRRYSAPEAMANQAEARVKVVDFATPRAFRRALFRRRDGLGGGCGGHNIR